MRCRVQVVMETDDGERVQEIAALTRETTRLEDVGLTLAEAKTLLAGLQQMVVEQQMTDYLAAERACRHCGQPLFHKGQHAIVFRTLFGNLTLPSPRLFHCACRPQATRTFSPLAELLSERTAPERLYLETKWAARVSFDTTAQLLADVLPVDERINAAGIRHHLHRVAERSEAALGEEQFSFIDGCPYDWAALPRPPAPLTVGIDGGYVRQWEDKQKHFAVIVGKSIPDEGSNKRFGFVQAYDTKPKRRLFEVLKSQGMQMNQQVTFLSDGGDDVRALQLYLNPEAEHYLDWFHVSMRVTVLSQYAKGLPATIIEDDEAIARRDDVLERLESAKWYLWHGNVFRALEEIASLEMLLDTEAPLPECGKKLVRALGEFHTYIRANEAFIPNYGERWRNQERIATGFVESTVNEVVAKRMVKKQQMQWTQRGAHLLLQMRTKVLNDELEQTFRGWYPGFRTVEAELRKAA